MTKAEIVEIVRSKIGVSQKDSIGLVDGLFELIRESLEKGEYIKMPGFGNFSIRNKVQRTGRNPKTGEAIPITARKIVSFKPSVKLKERVNNGTNS